MPATSSAEPAVEYEWDGPQAPEIAPVWTKLQTCLEILSDNSETNTLIDEFTLQQRRKPKSRVAPAVISSCRVLLELKAMKLKDAVATRTAVIELNGKVVAVDEEMKQTPENAKFKELVKHREELVEELGGIRKKVDEAACWALKT